MDKVCQMSLAHFRKAPYVELVERNAFPDEQLRGGWVPISLASTWILPFCSWRAFSSASFSISNISFSASNLSVIESSFEQSEKCIFKGFTFCDHLLNFQTHKRTKGHVMKNAEWYDLLDLMSTSLWKRSVWTFPCVTPNKESRQLTFNWFNTTECEFYLMNNLDLI